VFEKQAVALSKRKRDVAEITRSSRLLVLMQFKTTSRQQRRRSYYETINSQTIKSKRYPTPEGALVAVLQYENSPSLKNRNRQVPPHQKVARVAVLQAFQRMVVHQKPASRHHERKSQGNLHKERQPKKRGRKKRNL